MTVKGSPDWIRESWAYWGMDRVSLLPGVTVKVIEPNTSSVSSFGVPLSAVKVKVTSPTALPVGIMVPAGTLFSPLLMLAMSGASLLQEPEVYVGVVPVSALNVAWSWGKDASSRAMVVLGLPSARLTVTLFTSTWASTVTVWVTRWTVTQFPWPAVPSAALSLTWSWTVTVRSWEVGVIE